MRLSSEAERELELAAEVSTNYQSYICISVYTLCISYKTIANIYKYYWFVPTTQMWTLFGGLLELKEGRTDS